MKKILFAAFAVLASSSAFAAPHAAVHTDSKVDVHYKGGEVGQVDAQTIGDFITRTNTLLAYKDMSIRNGADGVKEITPDGVKVELKNGRGQVFDALVKTDLLKNVGFAKTNGPWILGSEVKSVDHIEERTAMSPGGISY